MKSAHELIEDLGWTKREPRSAYDAAVFAVIVALERELAETRRELGELREQVADALVAGGTLV